MRIQRIRSSPPDELPDLRFLSAREKVPEKQCYEDSDGEGAINAEISAHAPVRAMTLATPVMMVFVLFLLVYLLGFGHDSARYYRAALKAIEFLPYRTSSLSRS